VSLPVLQVEPLRAADVTRMGPVSDTGPLGLGLGAVQAVGARECFLAGFDGYEMATVAEQELSREVEATLARFLEVNPGVGLRSLTATRYQLEQVSVYGLVAAAA
jgi:4-hydroxy 2-oxovalerate aldolase